MLNICYFIQVFVFTTNHHFFIFFQGEQSGDTSILQIRSRSISGFGLTTARIGRRWSGGRRFVVGVGIQSIPYP